MTEYLILVDGKVVHTSHTQLDHSHALYHIRQIEGVEVTTQINH